MQKGHEDDWAGPRGEEGSPSAGETGSAVSEKTNQGDESSACLCDGTFCHESGENRDRGGPTGGECCWPQPHTCAQVGLRGGVAPAGLAPPDAHAVGCCWVE